MGDCIMESISNSTRAFVVAGVVALGGCTPYQGQNEAAGMVIGGALGGALGSQVTDGRSRTAAIIAGTLLGGRGRRAYHSGQGKAAPVEPRPFHFGPGHFVARRNHGQHQVGPALG